MKSAGLINDATPWTGPPQPKFRQIYELYQDGELYGPEDMTRFRSNVKNTIAAVLSASDIICKSCWKRTLQANSRSGESLFYTEFINLQTRKMPAWRRRWA